MINPDNIFFNLSDLADLHETAIIGKTVRIRKPGLVRIRAGSIIDDFTYISCGLTVGRFTHIGANSVIIGGDAQVDIGDFVNIAPGIRLIAASNDFSGGGLVGPTIPAAYASASVSSTIKVADHVLFGTNVVVLPGTSVPEGLSAGAGTVLSPKIVLEPWTVYVGNPARPIKLRARETILADAERLKRDRPDVFH